MHTLAMKEFKLFENKKVIQLLKKLYGDNEKIIVNQISRYESLLDNYFQRFSDQNIQIFSTPGRTEICGNHTDHNNGRVLAASINLDSISVVSKNKDNIVTLYSDAFKEPFVVNLNELNPKQDEYGNTASIIRGTASRLSELGFKIGGFNACISSDIPIGSGLSSSASIEVLVADIFNYLYNQNKIKKNTIALISQYVENNYFGKPCGLMDQLSICLGGIVAMDFKDQSNPITNKIDFELDKSGYSIVVVNTGDNHADLTDEYASIPKEMKSVSESLGFNRSCDLALSDLINNIKALRKLVGDRAILRMNHFITENDRVLKQINALENGEFDYFLDLVNESGNSSFKWLQNNFSVKTPNEQGITLALMISENYLKSLDKKSACRVHGGGFAGTIQTFIPTENVSDYVHYMNKYFGENSAHVLNIRSVGTVVITE